jgi:hypothetical protein|tara:strand:- start:214 stop:1191 length:978 start_codon:yes stop_codon:yes gene_type:complete
MAVPTNTQTTYTAIGEREDLSDRIWEISPTETPFVSNIDRVSGKMTFHEWQTDSLAAAAANTVLEGDDASVTAQSVTTRLGNYQQILDKTVSVSGSLRAADTAGRADEFSYQVAKFGRELKRDIEYACVRNQASSAGGVATARALGSVESWIATNKTHANAGTATISTTIGFTGGVVAAPTDGTTPGAFTEADLKVVIQAAWTQGGSPDTIMVGPFNKRAASAFTGIAALRSNVGQGDDQATIIAAADVYHSDFGALKIVANRFNRDRTVLVLDMELWAVAEFRPMTLTPLAKTGDSDKAQLLTELTLVSRNELGNGKVTDVTSS